MSKNSIIIFSGYSCAGKTTAALELKSSHGYEIIEASSFMRELYAQQKGKKTTIDEFAFSALKSNPFYVAELVAKRLNTSNCSWVVSGFRDIKEINFLRLNCKEFAISSTFIIASQNKRLERCFIRDRFGAPKTVSEFKNRFYTKSNWSP